MTIPIQSSERTVYMKKGSGSSVTAPVRLLQGCDVHYGMLQCDMGLKLHVWGEASASLLAAVRNRVCSAIHGINTVYT